MMQLTKALLMNHDAPEHTRLRKIVSRLFTPRAIASLEESLAIAARDIVRSAAEKDTGNFVDDVRLIQADLGNEGGETSEPLGDVEFAFFVILLAVAGNETTRNAMTHGMNAFFENPDQRELFTRSGPTPPSRRSSAGPLRCTVSSARRSATSRSAM